MMIESAREYEATVVSTSDDPKDYLRVTVRVHGLMDEVPDNSLPLATYKLPIGAGADRGDFTPAQKGDVVWVDFPHVTLVWLLKLKNG